MKEHSILAGGIIHLSRRKCTLAASALFLSLCTVFTIACSTEGARPANATVGKCSDWGLSFQNEGSKPVGNASTQELLKYDAYYMSSTNEKVLYLTFDCGYENGNTEKILDALKKHNAKATFFVVGHYLNTAPTLVKRMVKEGHTVGNHTFHHPDMSKISDLADFKKELCDVAEKYQELVGSEMPKYYRPPQGKYSVENLKMAQQLQYKTFFWSLAYVDWNKDSQPSTETAFSKLCGRVHPGAVVLLHNTSSTNGEIMDELLTKWEAMGYTFKPLSSLVKFENSGSADGTGGATEKSAS